MLLAWMAMHHNFHPRQRPAQGLVEGWWMVGGCPLEESIHGNQWKSLEINENHWKSMKIIGNHWKSLHNQASTKVINGDYQAWKFAGNLPIHHWSMIDWWFLSANWWTSMTFSRILSCHVWLVKGCEGQFQLVQWENLSWVINVRGLICTDYAGEPQVHIFLWK